MKSVFYYFNNKEKDLIKNFENQISKKYKTIRKITKEENKYSNDRLLCMKKYQINLFRQIEYIKDDIKGLKMERILENLFYEKKIIKHNNINSLNKDILQVINDFDFGGTQYLYYKENNEDYYHITTHINNIIELLKEGWIQKIYKGNYIKSINIDELNEECELIFDSITMYFKPINLLSIRESNHDIYIGFFNVIEDNKEKYIEKIFNDLCDFDNFEEEILSKKIIIKSIEVKKINEVYNNNIYYTYCFSIDKTTNELHKTSIITNSFEKQLIDLFCDMWIKRNYLRI